MAEVLFSIIIPHYNIPECLKTLLDTIPDRPEVEVIVVDDKSDKEIETLKQYIEEYKSENRHFYFNDTEQKGAGVCRNIGMEHAKGKWLLFADADDRFTDDMYEAVSSYADSEDDIIFFTPTSLNLSTGEISDRHVDFCNAINAFIDDPSENNELVLRYQVVSPWSKLIKRQMVVDNKIFFEATRVANDVFFCRQIGYWAKKIGADKRIIYVVTERSGSLTTLIGRDAFFTRLNVFVNSTKYVRKMAGRQTLKKMNCNGSYFLHLCRVNRLGLFSTLKTAVILLKNGIRPL